MTNINAYQSSYNSLDFSFKTSSGDTISLNMYDNKELSYDKTQNSHGSSTTYTLTHAYGYEFSYKGNGIDENDQKEIDEALKKLEPKIDTYLENVSKSGIPTPRDILNSTLDMRQDLPQVKDENHKNAISDSILKMLDEKTPKYFPNPDILEGAKALFDKLLEQLDNFTLYA